ncbi:hypothetical protein TRIUR3_18832 [Triticum urartu]|uniref:Uncharacterized protein n=1 Tax=Triticum urartu TaxID=4572 RepID=M7ZPI6_TRIUA|nr:hypothetical protein TRIUR3_18832 [Triticum urartu]
MASSPLASPARRALLLSSFLLCFLPRHVAAGAAGAAGYVTVSTASFAASSATCDEPGPGGKGDQLNYQCELNREQN